MQKFEEKGKEPDREGYLIGTFGHRAKARRTRLRQQFVISGKEMLRIA